MDDKKRAPPFGRRQAGLGLVAAVTLFLVLCNFDADFLDGGASGMHAATADQMYEPTYPDDGAASFGVIYAANGPFVVRAFESALALGVGANATIFSDAPGARSCEKLKRRERKHVADRLGHLRCAVANASDTWGFRAAKLWAFTATPYDKTLYLDADAFPCASFDWLRSELSPALERYDVMATHSSMRRGFAHALHWLNAGVIAFNARRRPAKRVFAAWLRTYERQTVKVTDQRLFNEAVLASDARVMALPPEFNCKSNYKSVRYGWLKLASPFLYRRVRKDWACCQIESVGRCVVDHECKFPRPLADP